MSIYRSWIFQGNPKTFDVDTYLRTRRTIHWTVKPLRHIEPGDRAFIWRADGFDRGSGGIVAIGWVTSRPEVGPDDAPHLWRRRLPEVVNTEALRVPIALDEVRLTPQSGMLLRTDLEHSPDLAGLQILRYRALMVCPVSDQHAELLERLWNQHRNA
jgi:hypothetical protein